MRQSFDQGTPVHEQLMRIVKSHTGRKHQHRKGPGRVSAEARARRKQNATLAQARWQRCRLAMRRYWSGEVDEHP